MWNPDVYLAFADHRGRPFFDLLSRVGASEPRRVVDLGCGPGLYCKRLGADGYRMVEEEGAAVDGAADTVHYLGGKADALVDRFAQAATIGQQQFRQRPPSRQVIGIGG